MRIFCLTIASLLAAAPASAAAPTKQVSPAPTPEAQQFYDSWGFSGAVRSGDMIYVSGVVGTQRPNETGPEQGFVRAFEALSKTLALAGASWDDVVDMTSYHTDLGAQMDVFRSVKSRYVKAPFPAWTAIGVSRLVPDRGLVEIKVVARAPAAPPR
ncbi:MAG TPA: RidA family protein [Allosphingosinicella sp.]|uniref:RidA family protein n=1 Tax=Allosphingosinicella sp. TaxID=2823234 RepID=UPI002ED979CF